MASMLQRNLSRGEVSPRFEVYFGEGENNIQQPASAQLTLPTFETPDLTSALPNQPQIVDGCSFNEKIVPDWSSITIRRVVTNLIQQGVRMRLQSSSILRMV